MGMKAEKPGRSRPRTLRNNTKKKTKTTYELMKKKGEVNYVQGEVNVLADSRARSKNGKLEGQRMGGKGLLRVEGGPTEGHSVKTYKLPWGGTRDGERALLRSVWGVLGSKAIGEFAKQCARSNVLEKGKHLPGKGSRRGTEIPSREKLFRKSERAPPDGKKVVVPRVNRTDGFKKKGG